MVSFINKNSTHPHEQKFLQYVYCQKVLEYTQKDTDLLDGIEIQLINDRAEHLQECMISFTVRNIAIQKQTLVEVALLSTSMVEVFDM